MANYCKTILLGNVTRDPELRTTQSGMQVLKLGMAVNRKRDGETKTTFVDCTAFGKSAEVLNQYVKKGDPLFVDGRLEMSSWEAKDGTKRTKLEVVVENFQLMPRQVERQEEPQRHVEQTEDLPF